MLVILKIDLVKNQFILHNSFTKRVNRDFQTDFHRRLTHYSCSQQRRNSLTRKISRWNFLRSDSPSIEGTALHWNLSARWYFFLERNTFRVDLSIIFVFITELAVFDPYSGMSRRDWVELVCLFESRTRPQWEPAETPYRLRQCLFL